MVFTPTTTMKAPTSAIGKFAGAIGKYVFNDPCFAEKRSQKCPDTWNKTHPNNPIEDW